MSITSDKFKTSYNFIKKDNTIPIVFIHGVGLTKEIWFSQIEYFKNNSILTYDLIGHGGTPLEKNQLNFEDFVKQLTNLINELNLKKIHLVGFSLGSLIARHFASKNNDRLNSLNLHGSIYKRSMEQKRIVENRFELIKTDKPASRVNALRRWFSEEFIKNNKEIYDKIYSTLENNDLKNFVKSYKLFVFYEDEDDMINNIKINTLVTTGQFDIGSTVVMGKNLSGMIKTSKFEEIKNGKHLCNIECSHEYNKILEKFIKKNND
ncbi:alpha/beta hydrolase [Candidatus Pelagibacter sp.]|nr:alpha/beta hydrolase [Candidatus Pelagibacter sp.]